MELFDFVDGVKEDKYLRLFIDLLIKVLKDGSNHILMHFSFISQNFIIILHSLKSYSCSSKLAMNQIIYVEFDHIFCVFFIEG